MESTDALVMSLALHDMPARAAMLRSSPLPLGVTELVKVALGQEARVASATAATGASSQKLIDAAKFFIEQLMLARECEADVWRVLGVRPGAPYAQIAENRRLLLSLIHPDRSDDWAEGYADRLHRAWKALKTPESRQLLVDQAVGHNEFDRREGEGASDRHWDETPARHEFYAQSPGPIAHDAGQPSGMPVISASRHLAVPGRRSKFSRAAAAVVSLAMCAGAALVLWPDDTAERRGQPVRGVQGSAAGASGADVPSAIEASIESATDAGTLVVAEQALIDEPSPIAEGTVVRELKRAAAPSEVASLRAAAPAAAPEDAITVNATAENLDTTSNPGVTQLKEVALQSRPKPSPNARRALDKPNAQIARQDHALSAPIVRERAPPSPLVVAADPQDGDAVSLATEPPVSRSPPRTVVPTNSEAADALDKFAAHYSKGNLDALLALFSSHNRGDGGASIAADYGSLFASTRERSLALKGIGWIAQEDRLVGQGWYEAQYRQQGKMGRQTVSGRIQFELVREGDNIRFANVSSQESAL